jgi:hypothetical protein
VATWSAGNASPARTDPPTELFRRLEGRWGCSGGFPGGRTLSADLTLAVEQDGRVLRFTHIDRAPSSSWQEAIWAFDAKSTSVFSLSTSGANTNRNVSAALFSAKTWSDRDIALVADSLNGPPWTPNRFTYALHESSELAMRWEVQRGAIWALGDSLVCSRVKPTTIDSLL